MPMQPKATITADMLRAKGACEDQFKLFEKTFPEGLTYSADDIDALAQKHGTAFDADWAAQRLLRGDSRKAYEEAEAPLWKAYEEAKAPLWKAYKEAIAPLLKAYEEAKAPLWKAYEEAKAPLWKAYEEAIARVFLQQYLAQSLADDNSGERT